MRTDPSLITSGESDGRARSMADAVARRSYGPEGWLLTAARRKLIDFARRRRTVEFAGSELARLAEELEAAANDTAADLQIPDHRLALMFACAHPSLDAGVRAPLILQVLLGLDAAMIASAFLVSPVAMRQRLVRAKDKIRQAGIPLRIPERQGLPDRLGAVLDAIYAAFSEGSRGTATARGHARQYRPIPTRGCPAVGACTSSSHRGSQLARGGAHFLQKRQSALAKPGLEPVANRGW